MLTKKIEGRMKKHAAFLDSTDENHSDDDSDEDYTFRHSNIRNKNTNCNNQTRTNTFAHKVRRENLNSIV